MTNRLMVGFRHAWSTLALCAGCGFLTGCRRDNGTTGPCTAIYEEPLFSVAEARDAQTGAALSGVVLRQFVYDGSRPPISFLTDVYGLKPTHVAISGTELLCTVTCAFGAAEGGYTFTFGATGYRDTTFTVANAAFARSRGGCPRYFSGGLILRLQLTSQ